MSKWLARLKKEPKEATHEQVPKVPEPIWNGGTLETGACHQCGVITSAMVTRPDGFAGWCCLECFDKRAANAMADDIRERAKENQGQRNDIPQKSAKSKPIDTRSEIAKERQVRKPDSVVQKSAQQDTPKTRDVLAKKAGGEHD